MDAIFNKSNYEKNESIHNISNKLKEKQKTNPNHDSFSPHSHSLTHKNGFNAFGGTVSYRIPLTR